MHGNNPVHPISLLASNNQPTNQPTRMRDKIMSNFEYYDAHTGEGLTEDELYTMYDNMLDEVYDTFTIGYLSWDASRVLSQLDPIAYRCGFHDYVDSLLQDESITDEPPTDDSDDN